ncbi:hypothetical protein SALBM311S_04403 [Streptomyces alboniger]
MIATSRPGGRERRREGSGGPDSKRLVRWKVSPASSSSLTGRGRGTVSERGITLVAVLGAVVRHGDRLRRHGVQLVRAEPGTRLPRLREQRDRVVRADVGIRAVEDATSSSSSYASPGTRADGGGTSSWRCL